MLTPFQKLREALEKDSPDVFDTDQVVKPSPSVHWRGINTPGPDPEIIDNFGDIVGEVGSCEQNQVEGSRSFFQDLLTLVDDPDIDRE
jgi:hypothetical protein